MLYLTKIIGAGGFIYDSDDGTIEFTSLNEVKKVMSEGVVITEIHDLAIPMCLCNWNKDGSNIFEGDVTIQKAGTWYVLISKGKQFKFKLVKQGLLFTNGITVQTFIGDLLKNKSNIKVL